MAKQYFNHIEEALKTGKMFDIMQPIRSMRGDDSVRFEETGSLGQYSIFICPNEKGPSLGQFSSYVVRD